jgi:hypothetical protein
MATDAHFRPTVLRIDLKVRLNRDHLFAVARQIELLLHAFHDGY